MPTNTNLHGVFAYTIFGDRIRVAHYTDWDSAIEKWDTLDTKRRAGDVSFVKFFAVRSWADPDWNTSRFRSMDTLLMEQYDWSEIPVQ